MAITLAAAARNAAVNGVVDLLDVGGAGSLVLTTSGGSVLATLPLPNPAFGAAASGSAALSSAIQDPSAAGAGTAAIGIWKDNAGTEVFRCSVGTSGTDIVLDDAAITVGAVVNVTAYTHTQPAS